MPEGLEFIVRAVLIGAGATAVLDLWAVFATRVLGLPPPTWAMVGRWIGHFPQGRFVHQSIGKATPVPHELVIGWVAHYVIGIFYGALLVAIMGLAWARHPTILPPLVLALALIVAPFFIMQPGMGAGIAASKTPNPTAARLRSLAGHTIFGLGLYAAALVSALIVPA